MTAPVVPASVPAAVLLDRAKRALQQAEGYEAAARGRSKLACTQRELAHQYRELAAMFLRAAVGPIGTPDERAEALADRIARRSR